MADKKQESSFTVTDRRLFTADGELRSEAREETELPKQPAPAPKPPIAEQTPVAQEKIPPSKVVETPEEREMPVPPTNAEQEAQAAAYRQSSKDLDTQVELSGHSAKEFEITKGTKDEH